MITDPIFILSIIGMSILLIFWIKSEIDESSKDSFIVKNISILSTFFGLMMLYSIFINAGDLSIVLLVASVVSLIVLIVGIVVANKTIVSSSRGYFIPIFLIFVLRTFMYEPYQIPSGSMMPGLKVGDFLLVDKNSYGYKINRIAAPAIAKNDPDYGDVVVFVPKHNPVPYVKRLIGKPGDKVRLINKQVYINGKPIIKTFYKTEESTITKRYRDLSGKITTREKDVVIDFYYEEHGNFKYLTRNIRDENIQYPSEWEVPPGHYFVMGDNRDNSNDSTKDVGFVPRENFFGQASYLFMSWECWTCLPHFSRVGKIN
ncbi:signal peptidase I [Gammaproteobacteria bacterium]|nr:signal peptidase I [Gammaproteobacteria bacterium]MDA9805520.1 signal peptidase I [Gammaproteobacteria bacterium]